MNAAINIGGSHQINAWYQSLQGTFLNIGAEFGFQQEEIKDFINQFFLGLLEKNIDTTLIQNPHAYLSTAFRRKLIDHHRKYGNKRLVPLFPNQPGFVTESIQDTLEHLEANSALITAIRKAFEKLPTRCRKVIYLKYYEGLSTEDIARKAGLTKRSVYNNLFEGIKILREELNQTVFPITFVTLVPFLVFLMSASF